MRLPFLSIARRWGPRVAFSIADQGFFSSANFVLNVSLARWLAPQEYGAFAVALAAYLFLIGLYTALFLEPMSVLGAARPTEELPAYLSALVRLHFQVTGVFAVGAVVVAMLVGDQHLKVALLALALATPGMLLVWLVRRAQYLRLAPSWAALSSLGYCLALGCALLLLERSGWLSAWSGLLAMGLASLVGSVIGLRQLGLRASSLFSASASAQPAIRAAHWNFGRWPAAAMILSGNNQIQTFLVATLLGLSAAGTIAAMQVFMLPMMQALIAVGGLVLPMLSSQFIRYGLAALRRRTRVLTLALVGAATTYSLVLWAVADPLERLVYGAKFADFVWLIPIFGCVPVLTAITMAYSMTLSAMQRPKHFLVSSTVTSVTAVLSAVSLTYLWGIGGAAASVVLTYASGAMTYYCLYRGWVVHSHVRQTADDLSRV